MHDWYHDHLSVGDAAGCPKLLFARVQAAARELGFEFCAFGIRLPFPLSRPRIEMFNDYPEAWQAHYARSDYLSVDPSVAHGRSTTRPALWNDALFASTPALWSEARDAGLRHGWIQSSLETSGAGGMLTLARSGEPITEAELKAHGTKMSWLAHMVHHAFARLLLPEHFSAAEMRLTAREIEVLRWTADGKTTSQISDILAISDNTVNFHIKNAMSKLRTSNKTSATVRAALIGILA